MKQKAMVEIVTDYIEKNLKSDLTLDQVAEYAGYSKFHLNRCFGEEVGCTVYKYIRLRRMTESARTLAESDQPIIEIALEAGYQSQQAFSDAFREVYQCPPNTYRLHRAFEPRMSRYQRKNSTTISCNLKMRRLAA